MRVAQTNLCRISCMFLLLVSMTEVFPCFFLSYKANARVKLGKTGARPALFTIVICVVRLLFVLFYVLFVCKCVLPPGDNRIAVNKYIISLREGHGRKVFENRALRNTFAFKKVEVKRRRTKLHYEKLYDLYS